MSLELILVPMAIAIISRSRAQVNENSSTASARQVGVETRMKNENLLVQAMERIGCTASFSEGQIRSSFEDINFVFKKNHEDIWEASFVEGTSLEVATDIISRIDKAYGAEVQSEVLRRIKERAPSSNMILESETLNADNSVTLVLGVNA